MAYEMEYAFQELKKMRIRKKKNWSIIGVTLLLAAAVIAAQFGGGLLEVILLGRHEEIPVAASEMVTNLREGMAFDEAVYVFCEGISYDQAAN